MAKQAMIRLKVQTIAPDPVQYKPYNPVFEADGLYLEVPVNGEIIREGDRVILDIEGFKSLLINLDNMIDDAHQTRISGLREKLTRR